MENYQDVSIDENINKDQQYMQALICSNRQGTVIMAYVCKICGEKFSVERDVKVHIRNVHNITNKVIKHNHNFERPQKRLHSQLDSEDLTPVGKQLCNDTGNTSNCNVINKTLKTKEHETFIIPNNEDNNICINVKEEDEQQIVSNDTDNTTNCNKKNTFKTKEPETCIMPMNEDSNSCINVKDDDKQQIICRLCDTQFSKNKKYLLDDHMEKIHLVQPNKFIRCYMDGCNRLFSTPRQFRIHLMDQEDSGGHDIIIKNEEDIFNNLQSKLITIKSIVLLCKLCDKRYPFGKKYMLDNHMKIVHFVQPNRYLKCCIDGCDKLFTALKILRMHLMDPEDSGGHDCIVENDENIFHTLQESENGREDIEENEGIKGEKIDEDGSRRRVYYCSYSSTYISKGKESPISQAHENVYPFTEINTENTVDELVCNYCKAKFKNGRSLRMHISNLHQTIYFNETNMANLQDVRENHFVCKYCNRNFKKYTKLEKHYRKIHNQGYDVAENIELQYMKKINFSEEQGSSKLEFFCRVCGKKYLAESSVKRHILNMHNSNIVHQCTNCKEILSSAISLEYHKQRKRKCVLFVDYPSNTNDDKEQTRTVEPGKYKCQICDKTFSRKNLLRIHMKKCHSLTLEENKPIKCCMDGCSNSFKRLEELRMHLMNQEGAGGHNVLIEMEEHIFNNYQEFITWKADMEMKENVRYVASLGLKTNKDGSSRNAFYCNRSGIYHSRGSGKRPTKAAGTAKIGNHCPSTVNIYFKSDGIVTCKYYKTHLGHETSGTHMKHIEISKIDKLFIAEKSLQGVDNKRILEELHMKGGRSALIKNKDIQNIQRSGFYKNVESCRNSRNLNVDKIDIGRYKVSSNYDVSHEITFLKYCACSKICLLCGVCNHSYICDFEECKNLHVTKFTCEHIHAVGRVNIENPKKRHFDEVCTKEEVQKMNGNCIPSTNEKAKKIEEAFALLNRIKSSLNNHSIERINETIEYIKKIDA